MRIATSLLVLVLTACSADPAVGSDAGTAFDAAADVTLDQSLQDAGSLDVGVEDAAIDAGPEEFGEITGECDRLMAELLTAEPSFFETRFDFADDPFDDPVDRSRLTEGGQEVLRDGNEGGSSLISETFAMEVLARCEGAELVKTETEITYEPVSSKKTDLLVAFGDTRIGVSVTRAFVFTLDRPYNAEDAAVMERKLDSILESSMNVVAEDSWQKQVLVILAYGNAEAEVLRSVWDGLDAETRADSIVYVIVTDGDDQLVYFE